MATFQVCHRMASVVGGSFPTLRMTVVTPPLVAVIDAGTTTVRIVPSHLHKDVQSQSQLKTGHSHTSDVVQTFSVCAKCASALDKMFGQRSAGLFCVHLENQVPGSTYLRQPRSIIHHHISLCPNTQQIQVIKMGFVPLMTTMYYYSQFPSFLPKCVNRRTFCVQDHSALHSSHCDVHCYHNLIYSGMYEFSQMASVKLFCPSFPSNPGK